ncbi:hypothetical protein GBZ26_09835 [Azospirillum formosense]|uniref:Secreted protein n=1 Tax=Azospirillum formosense TaxID=861533 RepID=A0ABX2KS87_9PROT|nr:hypothetical protein [Azospirillum formosense]
MKTDAARDNHPSAATPALLILIVALLHPDCRAILGGATPIEVATRTSPQPGPGHAPAPVAINAHSGHHMRGLAL